ncbi:MAG: sugar phosphate isomerase/epimerase [Chloroflexota bacterium]|nr:sugar phosphate isomerase/epimerase [Chloroflexota bacterium]
MKFAVFSVSIPDYTPEVAVTKLKEIGYDGIEWRVIDQDPDAKVKSFWSQNKATLPFSTFEQDAPAWRKLTEEAGLEMPGVGTYVMCDDLEGVEQAMRGTRALGATQLRVRVSNYDGIEPFRPKWDAARDQYKNVVGLAKKHGVKILLELHHRSIVPSASAARLFLGDLDPTHVGVIHDAGNMVHEGFESYRLGFEMLGPYLAHVHVKNARWFPEKYNEDKSIKWKCDWAPVHKGIIDMRDLFRAMHAVGYDGWVGLEDFSIERPLEDRLRENLEYLKRVEADAASA